VCFLNHPLYQTWDWARRESDACCRRIAALTSSLPPLLLIGAVHERMSPAPWPRSVTSLLCHGAAPPRIGQVA